LDTLSLHDALPIWITPGRLMHMELTDVAVWLEFVVVGLVVSGVISPSEAVRRLARSLFAWRHRGVPLLGIAALLVPAALALVAVGGVRLAHLSGHPQLVFVGSWTSAAVVFVAQLFALSPGVFAWYGFAAGRAAGRVPPLVVGLAVGLAGVLPAQMAVSLITARFGFAYEGGSDRVLNIAFVIALAIVAVWMTGRCRDSLLPIVVFLASVGTGSYVTGAWVYAGSDVVSGTPLGTGGAIPTGATAVYACVTIVLALLVVVAGRMWRPDAGDAPVAPERLRANPLEGYEVVIKDLGMPE
jgi:hypothetical protein